MSLRNPTLLARTGLMLGASMGALLIANPALAQETADPGTTDIGEEQETTVEVEPIEETVAQTTEEGEIIVTGSRIRRNEATSESPLVIIDPVVAQRQGRLDTAEIIQNSPIASGSTQITAALSSNAVANGGLGVQTISLRGLGASRTLVLLNSRRAGPAGTRGAISAFDLNVLPSSVIQSVEVLKDGASSIYGSDAIAGVVNLITKKDTDGLELTGFSSVPFESGGETYNLGAAWGKDFGRGHILLAGDYYRRNELERRDRDFLDCPEEYLLRPDGETRADLIDPRTGEFACPDGVQWGHVWAYSSSNLPDLPVTLMQFSYGDDNLGAFLPPVGPAVNQGDLIAPPGWFPVLYDCGAGPPDEPAPTPECLEAAANSIAASNAYHPFEQKSSVIPEVDRYTAYLDGAFELTDNIEVYAEGLFNRRRTYIDSFTQIYNFGYTNLFAPGDPEDPFPGWSGFDDPNVPGFFGAFISPTGIIDSGDTETTVDYYRGVAGVRGELGDRWNWDVYGQYSLSDGEYRLQQILNDSIYQQTLRGYGFPCAGEVTPIGGRECVQIPWTDPRIMAGDLTQEEFDYFSEWETGKTEYTQKYIEASISGEPFELWAGPVGLALGGTIRRDEIDDQPGHITMAPNPDDDPNVEGDEFVDNAFSNDFSSGHTFGHSTTKELFGEVRVPLLRDSPFAESLTFAGAARVTNVKAVRGSDGESDTNKGNWTYKLQGNWQVNPWLRFRATHGTSFRAPALFEQFLAGQVSGARQGAVDPCVNWGDGLVEGTITDRIAQNCAADGIPDDHGGSGLPVFIFTSGGLGELDPETSKATTASIILTPEFSFLPETDIAFTVDYFKITVKDQISQLTAAEILRGCYESDNFPNDPRCELFSRGADGNPLNISNVFARYINIDEQKAEGLDFTLRLNHDLGRLGSLSFLAQATRSLHESQDRLGEEEAFLGEVGSPKLVGNLHTTWEIGNTSLFWGMTYVGKMNSEEDFIELNGSLCNTSQTAQLIYGDYCFSPRTPAVWYHNASVTQRVMDRFEITLGVSNLFDTKPPRVSGVTTLGQVSLFATQYDWVGRRAFMQAKARF